MKLFQATKSYVFYQIAQICYQTPIEEEKSTVYQYFLAFQESKNENWKA